MQQLQVVRKKQSRYSKGIVIATSRKILKVYNEDAWLVESETTDIEETVTRKLKERFSREPVEVRQR